MRELIERFKGRYEIWRGEQRAERGGTDTNPLHIIAAVAAFSLILRVYDLTKSHRVDWRLVESVLIDVPFLILYLRRSSLAWLALPAWLVGFVLYLPTAYARVPPGRPHWPIMLFMLAFAAGGIVFTYFIRSRYHSYLGQYHSEEAEAANDEMQRTENRPQP